MAKFKANAEVLKRKLLELGYTDCMVIRNRGLNIYVVKNGKILTYYQYGYFNDFSTEVEFDEFVKNIDISFKK